MFQDDFFYDDEALQKIHDSFDDEHDWLVLVQIILRMMVTIFIGTCIQDGMTV